MLPAWLTDTVTSDLDRALHYTLLWGLEAVELRTVGRAHDRVPFVNEAKLVRRLAEHELGVAAVVPGLFEGRVVERAAWLNELAALGETLRFCRRVGCSRVVVSAFTEATPEAAAEPLRRAGEAAAQAGVTLAVLNEQGAAHATGAALAALLEAVDHAHVQAAWHPAEALAAGEDPARGLAALAGRVALVRCRDGRPQPGGWADAPLGEGAVGWADQLRRLAADGFEGPLSLELTGEARPRRGLHDATTLVHLVRQIKNESRV